MLSPHHMSKGAAVALAVGAFAAPVASAMPIGGYSPHTPSAQSRPVTAGAPSAPLTGYSPQDKQISPRPIVPAWASAGAIASHATVAPNSGGGSDWGDAGIGAAGGLALSIVAIGGGLVLVERRARRTETTAVATN